MIPKVIHYCWFGRGEKPNLAKKCIDSWKRKCMDYKIIEWNEDSFDVNLNSYTKYCYENSKWAYLSDFVRLWAVHEFGGIYLDTDVEVIKSFDDLLTYHAFYGFENDEHVASGLGFGAEKGHITTTVMLDEYNKIMNDDRIVLKGCPILNTNALLKLGLILNGETQYVSHAIVLSKEYLNPLDDSTGKLEKTLNTYSIHWYAKSALGKREIFRSKITRPFHRMFGPKCFHIIQNLFKKKVQ